MRATIVKPTWIPTWIWEEFCKVDNIDPGSDLNTASIRQILLNKDCAVVWRTMDRRKGTPTKRRLQWLYSKGWREDAFVFGEAEQLFDAILDATGWGGEDTISASERRKIATKIERLASALSNEISDLRRRCGDRLPSAFDIEQQLAAAILSDIVVKENLKLDGKKEWKSEKFVEAFRFGVNCAMWAPTESLAALKLGSSKWKETKPSVPHVNDAGASRLHFIRRMTDYFRKSYGTPLRECVAVLTRCVYKCNMDAATVAKLAH